LRLKKIPKPTNKFLSRREKCHHFGYCYVYDEDDENISIDLNRSLEQFTNLGQIVNNSLPANSGSSIEMNEYLLTSRPKKNPHFAFAMPLQVLKMATSTIFAHLPV
jgi:hypothetical protein